MAIALNTTLRNARATAIVTEAGSGAKLAVYSAAYAAKLYESVCSATLGTVSGGVLTFNAVAAGTGLAAAGAGTVAAVARLFKSDGTTMVIEGLTVGTSGTNIVISNATIATGDSITTSAATITEGNA
jgi:hypothetical protein